VFLFWQILFASVVFQPLTKGEFMGEKQQIGTTEIDYKRRPTHSVFLVKKHGDKAVFSKVGSLWSHKDGKGFSQSLEFFDWNIKLLIRENK
jgi:hypothetical protein